MSQTPGSPPVLPRARRFRVFRSRWAALAAAPVVVAGGIALALASSGVPRAFQPPAGPPDTLRTGAPRPKVPALLETSYLERAAAGRKSEEEEKLAEIVNRYKITHTLARSIYQAAVRERIDPELAFRLIRVESVFDPDAQGRGALGLTQLMPGTARDIDPTVNTKAEVLDPETNMRLGFTNLRNMIEMFDDVRLGVIAYNRGEIAVQRALRRGKDPENGYGARVLGPLAHGGKPYTGTGLLPEREQTAVNTSRPDSTPRR